jgi:hypothetical protein
MTKKALPYDVLHDFASGNTLNNANTATAFQVITTPDCNATTFPSFPYVDGGSPVPPTTDGGTDGSSEAGTDAGGADAGTTDASSDSSSTSDAATDASADAPADAPQASNTCVEFSYDPDQCIANNAGATGNCWDGVIYSPSGTVGASGNGICIGDGAKHITFEARASRNVTVKFGGSGFGGDGTGTSEFLKNVTTSWQSFSLDGPTNIPNYNSASTSTSPGVWDGFSVVGIPDNMGGAYILVRNVRWTQ